MPVVSTPVLQKQQSKLPTSMRYERVQDILANDLALKPLLGPRTQAIDSRFGEKILFSKETVDVTQAIHADGKDAHKVPKNEVLRVAMRIMKLVPSNGDMKAPIVASEGPALAALPAPVAVKKKSKPQSPKASPVKQKPAVPIAQEENPEPKEAVKIKPSSNGRAKPISKPQPVKTSTKPKLKGPVTESPAAPEPEPFGSESNLPESELPPEKQPLHLPAGFDPKKYPHYDVQSSIYSLLLSSLTLAVHFEKYPGMEDRQKDLEQVLKKYLDTCNPIKVGT